MKKRIVIGILIIVIVIVILRLLGYKDSKKQVMPSEPSNAWSSMQEKADTKIESKDGWVRLWYQIKDFFGESHFIYNLTSKLADNGLVIRVKGEGVWMVSLGTTDVIPDLSMVPYFMIEAKKEAADLYLPFSDFGFRGDHTGDVSMPKPDEVKSLIFTPSLGWSEPGQSHFLEIKEIRTYKKGTPTETDKDGDGIPNGDDYDIDGDGWFNVLEGYAGTDQMDPSNFPDGKLITPSNGCYTGVLITSGATGIVEFESLTGMKPAIINVFLGWEINQDARLKMDRPFLEWIWRHGSIPRHSWFPEGNVRIQDILGGKHDRMLTALACEVKALKQPIIWPYGVEVNGSPLEPSNALWNFGKDGTDRWFEADDIFSHYGDPDEPDGIERWKDYVAYVRKVFDRHGVNNVVYLFHTLGVDYTESGEDILSEEEDILGEQYPVPGNWNTVTNYYPGARLVDWAGFSLNGPGWNGSRWVTIPDLIDESHLMKLRTACAGKPFMIPEFSFFPQANTDPEESRAELFLKVFAELKTDYPFIKAWMFGNTRALSPPALPLWVIAPYMGQDSPPDEIEAFRKAVTQDPYFLKDPILFPKSKNPPARSSKQEKADPAP